MPPSHISVAVRLRPSQKSDGPQLRNSITIAGDGVTTVNGDRTRAQKWKQVAGNGMKDQADDFRFQRAYDQDSTQADVFSAIAPLIDQVCKGSQATVFTYGVTGSGKTHTMEGTTSDPGLIRHSVQALFEKQERLPVGDMDIGLTYIEIFNNEIYDLLAREPTKLNIQDNGHGENIVKGLAVRQLSSMAEFELLSNYQHKKDRRDSSQLRFIPISRYSYSARHIEAEQGVRLRQAMHLAGSENTKISGGNADRMRESKEINQSLTTLSKVIDALRDGSAHVPYRDSKLTRVLQPALGGDSSALLICCIAPGDKFAADTINTLKFGSRSREVVNHLSDVSQDKRRSSSVAGSARSSLDLASRPTISSSRRAAVLTDKSSKNNTARPRPSATATGAKTQPRNKENAAHGASDPEQKKQKVGEKDLFEQFSDAFAQATDDGKAALCQKLLPIIGPLMQEQTTKSPETVPAPTCTEPTPQDGETVDKLAATIDSPPNHLTIASGPPASPFAANILPATVLEAVEAEVARMRTLPAEEKEAIGRKYCKKARVLLKNGDIAEANKYFRMAKGGSRDSSSLTSLIADIEVNGLKGRLAQEACKRKRDTAETSTSDEVSLSPSKRSRVAI